MKILIDLLHPAHVNFFKNTISALLKDDDEVIITYLDRGKLSQIVENEFEGIEKYKIGKHSGTRLSIIFEANIYRFLSFIPFIMRVRPNICLSVGSFTNGLTCKLFNIPNLQFHDDPEREIRLFLVKLTASEVFFPPITNFTPGIQNFNALKEWSYLSPKYFFPKEEVLRDYNIRKKEYIFIREVSTGSLNYLNQKRNVIASFAKDLPSKYTVILSLEDKDSIEEYPSNWILLDEPVRDVHSLIYYSKYLISSGDSMAREGAMLGVPSVYCGFRDMRANQLLMDKKMLFKKLPMDVSNFINELDNDKMKLLDQISFRDALFSEWIDVTDFILQKINSYRDN